MYKELNRSDYERILVVGDIHGCLSELKVLVERLEPLLPDDIFVFIGDYIDRGPDSKGVVDYLLKLKDKYNCVFLKGNHEDMFLHYLGYKGHEGAYFLRNGGNETIKSYGALDMITQTFHANYENEEALKFKLGKEHLDFYKNLDLAAIIGKYVFVHANLSYYNGELSQQNPYDMLWERSNLRNQHEISPGCKKFHHTVIHGHTPMKEVFVDLPYEINVDTGCVFDGKIIGEERTKLSCLIIDNDDRMKVVQVTKDDHIFNEYYVETKKNTQ